MAKAKNSTVETKAKATKESKTAAKKTEKVVNETVEEQINKVNTDIVDEEHNLEEIEEKINKELEPVLQLTQEINDVVANKDSMNEETKDMTDKEVVDYTKTQLDKALKLKERLLKINNSPKPSKVTAWWNGSSFDM